MVEAEPRVRPEQHRVRADVACLQLDEGVVGDGPHEVPLVERRDHDHGEREQGDGDERDRRPPIASDGTPSRRGSFGWLISRDRGSGRHGVTRHRRRSLTSAT